MNIKSEIKEIIVSLIPERATVSPENSSIFTYYVSWSNGSEAPMIKFFKPIAIQLSHETIIEFNSLTLGKQELQIKKIKYFLESKFKGFTPDFNIPTDSDIPNVKWDI